MRLRTIAMMTGALLLIGSGIWAYGSNFGRTTSIGAGGLPLIKADTSPIKIPPEEQAGDIIPNADSTVFAAMGTIENTVDPSMQNVTPPADTEKSDTDFAGFKTGFSLPKQQERKTESLFAPTEKTEEGTASKYYSGLAPEAVSVEPEQETVAAPEPVQEPVVVKKDPPPEPEVVPVEETPAEPEVLPPSENIAAQALEAEEKILIKPTAKPSLPKPAAPPPVTVAKAEAKPIARDSVENINRYYIQLASAPAGSDTTSAWAQLKNKHPQALSGINPDFVKVTIAGKGDYVRIQAGPLSQADANKRCAAIRASGGCLVVKR